MTVTSFSFPPLGAAVSRLSLRPAPGNANHHLWNNNGSWWCHFTVHHPDHTVERRRLSLHTGDLAEARRRRDLLLRQPNAALLQPA